MQNMIPLRHWVQKHPKVFRLFALVWLAPIAYFIAQYALHHAAWAESYIKTLNRFIAQPVSLALGILPFSFAEFLLIALVVSIPIVAIRCIKHRRFVELAAGLLALLSILYALFAGGWGVAYSREPYAQTAGLTLQEASTRELEALCVSLIEQTNALRVNAKEDAQGLYLMAYTDRGVLQRVQAAYDAAASSLPWLAGRFGNPKPITFSKLLSYTQITGIFSPFTFEANVNMNNSAYFLPSTACHEAAHLRGWAREDEANYIAYSVCVSSNDPDFAYSGNLLGLIYAMNALAGMDMDRYWSLQKTYDPGVTRDLAAHYEHWRPYEGKVSQVQEQVNDRYLQANHQADGVRSYGRMVDLMLASKRLRENE